MAASRSLGRENPVCKLFTRVLRRRAKPARTVRHSMASLPTSTGGCCRTGQWITAEVTLGAGRKQVLGTSNSSSGAV